MPSVYAGRYTRQEIPLLPGGSFLLIWEGDADLACQDAFGEPLLDAAWQAARTGSPLTLDLRGCTFLDSACLGCLVLALRPLAIHKRGRKALTVITRPQGHASNAARVLQVTGLWRLLTHEIRELDGENDDTPPDN